MLRFTRNKKTTNVLLVADDSEVLETTPREKIPWIDSIYVHLDSITTYSTKGYLMVQKLRSHQVFTRVQMSPSDRMGKTTGNKPKDMKCKLDTQEGVTIMLYYHINI